VPARGACATATDASDRVPSRHGARLPTIYVFREDVAAGGLMSYGPSFPEVYRRAGDYVDKILRGTKPADIPVEQPTKFDLVINLITAQAGIASWILQLMRGPISSKHSPNFLACSAPLLPPLRIRTFRNPQPPPIIARLRAGS
jgi:hypothetical protein